MTDILTWNSDLDNIPNDYSTVELSGKSSVFQAMMAILGTGTWAMYSSCNSVTFGNGDAVNRLGVVWDSSKWVRNSGGGPHSWFTLYCANLGIYMTLALASNDDQRPLTYFFSKTAPTGGSTTTRPIAADEWGWGPTWFYGHINDGSTALFRMNLIYSTRGDFWLFNVKAGTPRTFWGIAVTRLADTGANDHYPEVTFVPEYYWQPNQGSYTYKSFTRSPWFGRTGGGQLCTTGDPAMAMEWPCVWTDTNIMDWMPANSYGTQYRGRTYARKSEIWVVSNSSKVWSDHKGTLPDVYLAPTGMAMNTPDNPNSPTRRAIDSLWMPGINAAGPTY